MSSGNEQVIKYFIMEANEHLEAMQAALGNLQAVIEEYEECNTVYRAAHTIKGGAAMLGFEGIRRLSLLLENCFKYLREHPVVIDPAGHATFTRGIAALDELVKTLEAGTYDDGPANQRVDQEEAGLVALYEQIKKLGESSTKALPADFAPQAMNILKHMVVLFKQPVTPQSRVQLAGLCQKLSQLTEGHDLWQKLIVAVRGAVSHPQVPFGAVAPAIIRDLKAGIELLVAGKATNIAIGPELQRFIAPAAPAPAPAPVAPPAAAPAPAPTPVPAPAAAAPPATPAPATPAIPPGHILIPLEAKGAARALIKSMPKDRLLELAKYLAMAAKQ